MNSLKGNVSRSIPAGQEELAALVYHGSWVKQGLPYRILGYSTAFKYPQGIDIPRLHFKAMGAAQTIFQTGHRYVMVEIGVTDTDTYIGERYTELTIEQVIDWAQQQAWDQ